MLPRQRNVICREHFMHIFFVAIFLAGCRHPTVGVHSPPGPTLEASRTAKTITLLNQVAALIVTVHIQNQEDIPNEMHEVVKWLNRHQAIPPSAMEFDVAKFEIHDAWSNDLVLVLKDGIPTGIGSCGENEKWDNGENDDILALFSQALKP
jgi:hypothetical protein